MSYFAGVFLLMLVLPAASVVAELGSAPLFDLIAKWFVFFGCGARLLMAGLMQTLHPRFTSSGIFGIADPAAEAIVRELGFANIAMGTLGLATILRPDWLLPAALACGLFYGLAGLGHVLRKGRNGKEEVALYTDLAAFALLAAYVVTRAL